jgi:hypothetical protein
MKIHHVIGAPSILLSNEEREFVKKHNSTITLGTLDEHQEYLANNLIRKGVYSISNDKKYITRIDHGQTGIHES